jgi:DNA-binding XRE family transcriptional regulator
MQALTKKPRIDNGLVTIRFKVRPEHVDRIRKFVEQIEPAQDDDISITLDEFFTKHYPGQTEGAVYLRGIRARENMSQIKLAELTGIPQRHISEMENGKRPIGKERAKLLAKALNCDYRLML